MNNKAMDCTALTLTIIGAVNWGLIGFFNFIRQHELAVPDYLRAGRPQRTLSHQFLYENRAGGRVRPCTQNTNSENSK